MLTFFVGIVVGAGVVGSSIKRTLDVEHGDVKGAAISSLLNSATYFFSVYSIAAGDYLGFIGTAIGSTSIVIWMAYKKREQNGT